MYFYQTLLDAPASTANDIVSSLASLEPCKVRVIPLSGNESHYLDTEFLSFDDAYYYLDALHHNIVKVDDTTYATPTVVYKLVSCNNTL